MNSKSERLGSIQRRGFLKITAFAGLALGMGVGLRRRLLLQGELQRVVSTWSLLGTYVQLVLVAPSGELAHQAAQAAFERMRGLEAVLSQYRPDSPLSRLNAQGTLPRPPADLVRVLELAQQVARWTQGAFDVTVGPLTRALREAAALGTLPAQETLEAQRALVDYRQLYLSPQEIRLGMPGMALTLDGIGKGYVVDAGLETLAEHGFDQALVNAGGDLRVGGPAGDQDWRVGIQDPRGEPGRVLLQAHFALAALATSGDYLQAYAPDYSWHHILNPLTGRSPHALVSATALAPSAALADALSTAFMVLGPDQGLSLARTVPGVEALLIDKDMHVWRTPGFPTG